MANKCIFTGNLTTNPELKKTNSGKSYCSFQLAIKKYSKDGDSSADFFNFFAYDKQAENLCRYGMKGSKVYVEAKATTTEYTNRNGVNVKSVQFNVDTLETYNMQSASAVKQNTEYYRKPDEAHLTQGFNVGDYTIDIDPDDLPY